MLAIAEPFLDYLIAANRVVHRRARECSSNRPRRSVKYRAQSRSHSTKGKLLPANKKVEGQQVMNNLVKMRGHYGGLKTAIVCTLAPAQIQDANRIRAFVDAGMRIVRLNFSHVDELSQKDRRRLRELATLKRAGTLSEKDKKELLSLERKDSRRRERAWKLIEIVRQAEEDLDTPIGIMMDLCGPRLRTGKIKRGAVEIKKDDPYTFDSNVEKTGNNSYCSISSLDFQKGHNFVEDVNMGFEKHKKRLEELRGRSNNRTLSEEESEELNRRNEGFVIYVNDGRLKFKVQLVDESGVHCNVVRDGKLESSKGVNVPGCELVLPAVTQKDWDDLKWIFDQENKKRRKDIEFVAVNFIAQSFVKSHEDINDLRAGLKAYAGVDREIPIIAKIETPEALANLARIMKAADGAMVARGDLAVEISMSRVPKAQRKIINLAGITYAGHRKRTYDKGPKFVIVATQMIESMIKEVQPLRAEVTDINNAVREGADAIMTSAETIESADPLEVVKRMAEIAQEAEKERDELGHTVPKIKTKLDKKDAGYLGLAESACILAKNRNSPAIVVSTYTGRGAKILSSFKPCPWIIALTTQKETAFNLLAYSGVCPVLIDLPNGKEVNTESYLEKMRQILQKLGVGKSGEEIVAFFGITPGELPIGPHMESNSIRLFRED